MKKIILLILLIVSVVFSVLHFGGIISGDDPPVISDITIVPDLDISRFLPYNITAQITNWPTSSSATVRIENINGNGNTSCWDYYADGTCGSSPIELTMNYDSGSLWESINVYPDYIYPEIYFAPSAITWANAPSNISVRRGSYHMLHFHNPFTMTANQSFWIEFNSVPVNTSTSADMQIYLVEKNHDITYFNSDWRNNAGVELVGTFLRTATFHHTHSANSSHHLVTLSTNADKTVGTKSLDISGDFWVVIYTDAQPANRSWNLRYQTSSLCTNTNRWYVGNISGWTTTYQNGCPDVHIHTARRGTNADNVSATVIAGGSSTTETFSFEPLPNLPPNSTSFITPAVNGSYAGVVPITWDPASDPNGDSLTYNLFLLNSEGATVSTLATGTSSTSYNLSTVGVVANGNYGLKGEVCDGVNPCVEFLLGGIFTVDNTDPIRTISSVVISSNNSNTSYAKAGDEVTIAFVASGSMDAPTVEVYSGGISVVDTISVTNPSGENWEAAFTVGSIDTDGTVEFNISSTELDRDYSATTDSSLVTIDNTAPSNPAYSPSANYYSSSQNVAITSSGSNHIRFTTDGTSPTCSSGNLYSSPINVLSSITIKSVGCDTAGNISGVSEARYDIAVPAPTCSGQKIETTPDLFEIRTTKDSAQIFFTPISGVNNYHLSYSANSNAEEHGLEEVLDSEGVQTLNVKSLEPRTKFYFKIRSHNNCSSSDLSEIFAV